MCSELANTESRSASLKEALESSSATQDEAMAVIQQLKVKLQRKHDAIEDSKVRRS